MSGISQPLNTTNPWLYYPLVLGLILAAGIIGDWYGRRFHDPDRHPAVIGHLDPVQASLIGLLSLMIAFTFSLSLNRFEARQAAVIREATAISETRELAALLPAPHAAAADRLLGAYVATRVVLGEEGADPGGRSMMIDRSRDLQRALWAQAFASGAGGAEIMRPRTSLFVTSLNALEDRDEERRAADHNQVPFAVFLTLYALALLACGYSGYAVGVRGSRGMVSIAVLGLAIATVITLIADLDTPNSGLVFVSQAPLKNLELSAAPLR